MTERERRGEGTDNKDDRDESANQEEKDATREAVEEEEKTGGARGSAQDK